MSDELLTMLLRDATDLALFGFRLEPIVGIQHAEGATSLKHGVWVALVQEPANEFDRNAVRVDTKGGTKVGYIKKEDAKKIQPVVNAEPPFQKVVVKCMAVDSPDTYEVQSVIAFYGPEEERGTVVPLLKGLLGGGIWFLSVEEAPEEKSRHKKRKINDAEQEMK